METKKEKLTILVCAHKPDEHIRNYPPYKAIQVGAALHPEMDLGFLKDNVADNISEKNPKYCELSAIYWGWKNLKNVEYAGLAHYRRYFDIDINEDNVDKYFKNNDIITLERSYESCPIIQRIQELTTMEDVHIFFDTLLMIHPEYKKTIIKYCYNSFRFYRCTMFIAKKKTYDQFCETFFPVFFKTEERLKTHSYSRLNRAIAYFGELSLGLFIEHNKLSVHYVKPIEYTNNDQCKKRIHFGIKSKCIRYKRLIGFYLFQNKQSKLSPYSAVNVGFLQDGIELNHYLE